MLYVIYIVAALLVGWLGRTRQIGFAGFFLLALFFTPVLVLVVLMLTHNRGARLLS